MNYKAKKEFQNFIFNLFYLREQGDKDVETILKDVTIDNLLDWIDWVFDNKELAKKKYPVLAEVLMKMQIKENSGFTFANIIKKYPENFNEHILPKIKNCKIKQIKVDLIKGHIDFVKLLLNAELENDIENSTINKIRPQLNDIYSYLNNELTKKTQQPKEEPTFKDLFNPPYNTDEKINDLKTILKTHGYIDINHRWVGNTEYKNELATLYFVFNDKSIVLKTNLKKTPAIRTLYTEFGTKPTENELRNLTRETGTTETYEEFERIFENWIKIAEKDKDK